MEFERYEDVIDAFERDNMGYETLTDYIKGNNIRIAEIDMSPMGDLAKAFNKKDGGMMIAIEQLGKGGITGGKTYHQYHDQFVPPDSESEMYANGGGVGSMMKPKKKIPQLVKPTKDGSRPGYRGLGGYGGGVGGGAAAGGGLGEGPASGGGTGGGGGGEARDRAMGLQGKTGKTDRSLDTGGGFGNVDRSKVGQFSQYGRNVMNQNLTRNNPSRQGIFSNFNPLAAILGFINPFAGLLAKGIMGAKGKLGDLFGDFAGTMRGINPVTGKPNTQAEYEAMVADRKVQGRINNMTDRMLAGKTFSQTNLDNLMGMTDRFGNPFGTNLGNIDNARGSNLRGQLNNNLNTITNTNKPTANITATNLNDFEIGNPGGMIGPNDFEVGNPGRFATTEQINEFATSPQFDTSLIDEFGVKDRGTLDANEGLQFGDIPGTADQGFVSAYGTPDDQFANPQPFATADQGFGLMNSDAAKAAAMSVMSNAFNENVMPGTSDMGFPDRNMNFPDTGMLVADASKNNNLQTLENIINKDMFEKNLQPAINNQNQKNQELEKLQKELGIIT